MDHGDFPASGIEIGTPLARELGSRGASPPVRPQQRSHSPPGMERIRELLVSREKIKFGLRRREQKAAFWFRLLERALPDRIRFSALWTGQPLTRVQEIERSLRVIRTSLKNDLELREYFRSCLETGSISLPMLRLRNEEAANLLADFISLYHSDVKGQGLLEIPTLEDRPEAILPWILDSGPVRTLPAPDPQEESFWVRFCFARARGAILSLQEQRHEDAKASAALRKELLALGGAFVKTGSFEVDDDVFFLNWNELESSRDFTGDFRQLLLDRRAALFDEVERSAATGSRHSPARPLPGTACAGETVEGQALCIGSLHSFLELRPETSGKIVVARSFDSGWWRELLSAKGVVLEDPSPVSPAAILCREFGIPSLIGAEAAVSRIRSGSQVRLDPAAGTVVSLDR